MAIIIIQISSSQNEIKLIPLTHTQYVVIIMIILHPCLHCRTEKKETDENWCRLTIIIIWFCISSSSNRIGFCFFFFKTNTKFACYFHSTKVWLDVFFPFSNDENDDNKTKTEKKSFLILNSWIKNISKCEHTTFTLFLFFFCFGSLLLKLLLSSSFVTLSVGCYYLKICVCVCFSVKRMQCDVKQRKQKKTTSTRYSSSSSCFK